MRCFLLSTFALITFAFPAAAQQRVVVPAGAEIVIPPRGADGPALVRAPRPRIPPPGRNASGPRPMLESGGESLGGIGLAAPVLVALPLAIAAFAAASVPGSSSSTSAPARTR